MRRRRFVPTVSLALALVVLGAGLAEGGVKKFRKEQERPVKLGTSAGNARDLELDPPFVTCGGGTAGALLELVEEGVDGEESRYFVLSNNHVISMLNRGKRGDEIVQPGLIDSDCEPGEPIAHFSAHKKIRFGNKLNDVDMAIAEIVDGAVDTRGKILRIGVPGNEAVEATPGLEVKKAGRTTGFTRKGMVVATDLDASVEYASGTGSGAQVRSARYRDQILIQAGGAKAFHGSGDSGAVIYENVKKCPRAVGLLFAGDAEGQFSVANPMEKVLKAAKKLKPKGDKLLVGCDPAVAPLAALSADEDRVHRLARRAKERASEWVREIEGVVGIGVGRAVSDPTEPVVTILVERADLETLARIPTELDGVRTRVIETGRLKAF